MRSRAMLCATFFGALISAWSGAKGEDGRPIVVGSKIDVEGALLGNLILLTLEHLRLPVESRLQLGPTRVVRAAILSGDIDVYPEYTGNGAIFFRSPENPAWTDRDKGYELVKRLDQERNGIVWLSPGDANNMWAIAVRRELAEAENLETMEDFARFVNSSGHLRLAATLEFVESPAALPAFQKTYGFKLSSEQIVIRPGGESVETIRAASEPDGIVNCAMVYGTDGNIRKFGLVVMKDTKHAQVVYAPAAVIRRDILLGDRSSLMGPALSAAFNSLSLENLIKMNGQIVEGTPARDVARHYLQEQGLLK